MCVGAKSVENPEKRKQMYLDPLINAILATAALQAYIFKLKKDFLAMLFRNLQPKSRHVYCARYTVEDMDGAVFFSWDGT